MGHTSKANKRRKKDAAIIAKGFIKLPEGEKNISQTDLDRMALMIIHCFLSNIFKRFHSMVI